VSFTIQAGGPQGMPKKATTASGLKRRATSGAWKQALAMKAAISQAAHFSSWRRMVGMRRISNPWARSRPGRPRKAEVSTSTSAPWRAISRERLAVALPAPPPRGGYS